MFRLITALTFVTIQYMLLKGSRRHVKTVYKPYGPEMCREMCKESDTTFEYLEEELSCHRISRDVTISVTSSFRCPDKTARRGLDICGTNPKGKCLFNRLQKFGADTTRTRDPNAVLLQACKDGNLRTVMNILSNGFADINCRETSGRTPVMIAAIKGRVELFELLVSRGSDLSIVDQYGDTVLHLACMSGNIDIVKTLIKKQLDTNSRGFEGLTPVMNAASYGYVDIVILLKRTGCNVTVTDEQNRNVLHFACSEGHADMVRYILSNRICSIESREDKGKTPVMMAAENGHVGVVKLLASEHCDLGAVDNHKNNILHLACVGGHVVMVKYILAKNATSLNGHGSSGRTPLMMAAQKGHVNVLKILLRTGSDVSVLDDYTNNILHVACTGGNVDTVKYILSHNVSGLESIGDRGRTPLLIAARRGHKKVVELLVIEGCKVTAVDDDMNNVLHCACIGGDVDTVKCILLQNVSGLESVGDRGRTPLLIAARRGHKKVVELLVSKGCNVTAVDHDMNNVLHCACIGGHVDIVKYLLTLEGVRKMDKNKSGLTSSQLVKGKNNKTIDHLIGAKK